MFKLSQKIFLVSYAGSWSRTKILLNSASFRTAYQCQKITDAQGEHEKLRELTA